jgi:hypothetical protein
MARGLDQFHLRRISLFALRRAYGKGMKITSGYRCPSHPVEMVKSAPGSHSHGLACDVSIQGEEAYMLVRMAFTSGFLGIGIKQHGEGRYVHLDMASHVPPAYALDLQLTALTSYSVTGLDCARVGNMSEALTSRLQALPYALQRR